MSENSKEGKLIRARSSLIIAAAIMLSRVLGLLRVTLMMRFFGANRLLDAFTVAFRAPNMLRDMLAEGALSTAFITVFSKKLKAGGKGAAFDIASKMLTLATIFGAFISIVGILCAPLIIKILAPGFDAQKSEMTIRLTRILYPFIAFLSLASLVMGMLNSLRRFAAPALASSWFNLGAIIGGIGLAYLLDPTFSERSLYGLAIGALIGGSLQFLSQCPTLWRCGFRFRLYLRSDILKDDGVRKILSLMLPAVIAAAAIQATVAVNSAFASYCGDAAVTWLEGAFRLIHLPLGMFSTAIGAVALPSVSRTVVEINERTRAEFREILGHSLRFMLLLTLPSTVGLLILAEPIVALIFQGQKFTLQDTLAVAFALRMYAVGLIFYASIKVIQPTFYALDKRWTPMFISLGSIALSILLNGLMIFYFFKDYPNKHGFLALATSIIALINCSIFFALMRKELRRFETKLLVRQLVKIVLPLLTLGAICFYARKFYLHPSYFGDKTFIYQIGTLFGSIVLAAVAYFSLARLFKADGMEELAGVFIPKLDRKGSMGE